MKQFIDENDDLVYIQYDDVYAMYDRHLFLTITLAMNSGMSSH